MEQTRSVGRPTNYDPLIAEQICEDVANGHSIVRACINAGIKRTTIYNWIEAYPEFQTSFTRARQQMAHSLADDCLEIAEQCTKDNAYAAKVHIDTKWRMAARMNPIYSERLLTELSGPNGGPVQSQIDISQLAAMSPEQLRALSGVTSPAHGEPSN